MEGSISEGMAIEAPSQSECVSKQPQSNGPAPTRAGRLGRDASSHHGNGEVGRRPLTAGGAPPPPASEVPPPLASEAPPPPAGEAPPPPADRLDSSNGQLMVSCSTDNICGLLPAVQQKGEDGCPSPPVCAPSSSTSPIQTSTSKRHHHQRANQKRLSKDPASSMTDAAHIKEVAGDDICVHLLLSCLFCDLLYLCWAVGQCLGGGAGGAGPEAACCEAACCGAACCEAACQALLDCTVLEDCCGSSDCLEVCLDCCSICFPS